MTAHKSEIDVNYEKQYIVIKCRCGWKTWTKLGLMPRDYAEQTLMQAYRLHLLVKED